MVACTNAALHLVDLVTALVSLCGGSGGRIGRPWLPSLPNPRPQVAHLSIVRGFGAPLGAHSALLKGLRV